jgi:hypothetical protein
VVRILSVLRFMAMRSLARHSSGSSFQPAQGPIRQTGGSQAPIRKSF